MDSAGPLLTLMTLLLASAFFTAQEIGFLSLSRSRVEQWRENGGWLAGVVSYLYGRRALLLSVLILGITSCNYTAERIATGIGIEWLGATWGPIVAAVAMTAIILIFCETTPMHIAASSPQRTVKIGGGVVFILSIVFAPLVALISGLARGVLRIFGVKADTVLPSVSEAQLKAMIEACEEHGELEAVERRMLRGVLDFGDQTAAEVMTPRRDMVSVRTTDPLKRALEVGLDEGYSRLPVYEDSPDNIVGILSLKDLLPYTVSNEMHKSCRIAARPAVHVLETTSADVALRRLQSNRQMMAIVKDEYGGTAGLLTVEDLLEEIVGEIRDEYDQEEPEVLQTGPSEYFCEGSVSLRILQNYVKRSLPVAEFDSLGGWLLELAGRIPDAGETFREDGLTFLVEEVTETRIEKVRVSEATYTPDQEDKRGRR